MNVYKLSQTQMETAEDNISKSGGLTAITLPCLHVDKTSIQCEYMVNMKHIQ